MDEIKSRRDGPRTGNRHFILKKVKFYSRSRKKVTVLNLFYKGAVNAYFLTGSFFKKTVVFEAAIFVGQSEDGAEVRCEVSRRVETAVSRYSGPSGLRFIVCSARIPPSNSNKATDGAIETSRRTTRTDSQEPAPGTSMKPSYDPTKPWSRRRREFGASAQNGA